MKAMLIDVTRCCGCYNCQLACKDEHVDNDWSPYAKPQPDMGHFWMHIIEKERGQYPKVKTAYIPKPCMHCRDPKCLQASRNGAVYQREDGIVIIDPEKSKGQKQLVDACPYGSIYWNEELEIPQKCTFCAQVLDQGLIKEPRCVEVCPTEALMFGEYDDLKEVMKNRAEVLNPEYQTDPKVYYIGLPKRFVAGTVIFGDIKECAENVTVTLHLANEEKSVKTNNYGDFEFEGIEQDQQFSLEIKCQGYKNIEIDGKTDNDVYLGDFILNTG